MRTESTRGIAGGGEPIDFGGATPVSGSWDVRWMHGRASARQDAGPPLQVHAYDPHTFVIRQSKAVQYEAPFMHLWFGNDRAILFDTGATADADRFPIRAAVDRLIEEWLSRHPRDGYELVVAHTHGHGDHVAGDAQFSDRSRTTVVSRDVDAVRTFFGFSGWPDEVVPFDLGGRVLQVMGIPGHHAASIAVYDPWSGFLLTGDTVYPGRLYVKDAAAFAASLDRLVAFTQDHAVTHVVGCHIEMTDTPGRDYPIGCAYQPHEPPLQMSVKQLSAVRNAAHAVKDRPGAHFFTDFAIFNGPCTKAVLAGLLRGAAYRLALRAGR